MKNNKSQGLPINVLIIAVLALAVLVVLIIVFTGSIGKTSENIGSCITKGGICADNTQLGGKCGNDYPIPLFVSSDCTQTTPKNLCCIKAVGNEEAKK